MKILTLALALMIPLTGAQMSQTWQDPSGDHLGTTGAHDILALAAQASDDLTLQVELAGPLPLDGTAGVRIEWQQYGELWSVACFATWRNAHEPQPFCRAWSEPTTSTAGWGVVAVPERHAILDAQLTGDRTGIHLRMASPSGFLPEGLTAQALSCSAGNLWSQLEGKTLCWVTDMVPDQPPRDQMAPWFFAT